jgi:hypothetical protein
MIWVLCDGVVSVVAATAKVIISARTNTKSGQDAILQTSK